MKQDLNCCFKNLINTNILMNKSQRDFASIQEEPQIKLEMCEKNDNSQQSLIGSFSDNPSYKQGKWSDQENIMFVTYLAFYNSVVRSKEKRKSNKIFKNMSIYINTRSSQQCRSHFQKLMKKYKTLSQIKKHFKQEIGRAFFEAKEEIIKIQLELKQSQQKQSFNEASTQTELPYFFPWQQMFPNFYPAINLIQFGVPQNQ